MIGMKGKRRKKKGKPKRNGKIIYIGKRMAKEYISGKIEGGKKGKRIMKQ